MFKKKEFQILMDRLAEPRARIQIVSGPRQVGNYIKDSIIAPAISQDILLTKTIYKPELMKQVFDLGCTYSGEELSLNKMVGQLQDAGNVTTIANYLDTLNEAQTPTAVFIQSVLLKFPRFQ